MSAQDRRQSGQQHCVAGSLLSSVLWLIRQWWFLANCTRCPCPFRNIAVRLEHGCPFRACMRLSV
jgi:hypothetical protein